MELQLGDLYLNKGGSVDPSKYPEETFEYYSIPAYDSGNPEIVSGSEIGSSKKVFQPNDIILSRIVPHIRRCWVVGPDSGYRQIGSGEWITFRSDQVEPSYLRHYLMSNEFNAKFLKTIKGVGGSLMRADPKQVARFKFILPPLPQQKKIAAILDAADAYRQKTKALIAKYDELTQSLFLDMFGDPVTNPKGWEKKELSKLGNVVTGSTPPSSKEGMFGGNTPFVTPGDLEHNRPVKRTLTKEGAENSRVVRQGSLFVCCIGATIGKKGIAKTDSSFNQQINAVEWNELINDHWGLHAFTWLKHEVIERAISTTLPIMKKSEFEKVKVPCPPMVLQNQFAERVQAIEKQKAQAQDSLAKAEDLFNSLLQKAFKGELIT